MRVGSVRTAGTRDDPVRSRRVFDEVGELAVAAARSLLGFASDSASLARTYAEWTASGFPESDPAMMRAAAGQPSASSLSALALSRVTVTRDALTTIAGVAVLYPLVMVALAPLIAIVLFKQQVDLAAEPRREVARLVTQAWHEATQQPLRLVAGSQAYGTGMVFYSPDKPSEFTRLNYEQAPWVTPDRLKREGIAIACASYDGDCIEKASGLVTAQAKRLSPTISRRFWGMTGPQRRFEVFLIPPGDIPPIKEPMLHRQAF